MIWIQEIPSLLINPTSDLNVERWVLEARNGVELARWGLWAPAVTKFEVKGAFIDRAVDSERLVKRLGRASIGTTTKVLETLQEMFAE